MWEPRRLTTPEASTACYLLLGKYGEDCKILLAAPPLEKYKGKRQTSWFARGGGWQPTNFAKYRRTRRLEGHEPEHEVLPRFLGMHSRGLAGPHTATSPHSGPYSCMGSLSVTRQEPPPNRSNFLTSGPGIVQQSKMLSRPVVTLDGVWIGSLIYSTLITRNYNSLCRYRQLHTI
jgi:hypothetical protein